MLINSYKKVGLAHDKQIIQHDFNTPTVDAT